jgi:hypothetical protein
LTSPDELVRVFVDDATRSLTSLSVSPSLRCTTTILQYGDSGWEERSSAPITTWFDVTVSFASEAIEGAYRFGERDNVMWAYARKAGGTESFALSEWAEVLDKDASKLSGGDWVFEPERIRAIVAVFGDGLRDMHAAISESSTPLLTRLAAARAARTADDVARSLLREQERDEVQAAEAFRRGDYQTAVRLLRKHAESLSAAQLRKLAIAESKIPGCWHLTLA